MRSDPVAEVPILDDILKNLRLKFSKPLLSCLNKLINRYNIFAKYCALFQELTI